MWSIYISYSAGAADGNDNTEFDDGFGMEFTMHSLKS